MNTTWKPATNLILCAVWIVLIVLSLTVFSFVRLAVGIVGGALGLIAGFLQARALRANSHQFGETGSMLDVRKVMTSSPGGKISVWLLWINLAVVMVWSFKTATPGSIILGLASFKLARDLVTLPAVFRLARAVPAQIS
jgi:hypothetical protein